MNERAISFGPFRLLAAQRLLLEGDAPVRLGSRAFDILAALVERAGEVVGKEELIARVWPQTFVEESNLKIQVSALRRVLGDGQGGQRYVVTVPGRGYNFVAAVRHEEPAEASVPPTVAPTPMHNLPFAMTRMIGRDEAAATLLSRLSRERLVTVVGPGGIGKTTLALAVAERVIADYEHGVWLIDLAPLADSRLVPSAVATVLGVEVHTQDPLPGLVAALRDKQMLLLLDNCEHVIGAAASLATVVLGGAPGVNILATSREPLRVAGEQEYRLGSLTGPQPATDLSAAAVATFPAVQLFVERVSAVVEEFALTDANTPRVVEICRRLDGLPLAIEFAAPRVEVLGVEGLAAHLDDSLPGLGARRRTRLPRHRTMRAVVDWSYGLLSEDEQRFFRGLGIFAGGFTVEAAGAVAMGPVTTDADAIDRLADLVAKSLVVADVSGAEPRFRLLDTTRAFTLEKIDESGERARLARRHVEFLRNLFERAEVECETRPISEWLEEYGREIDNLRSALEWSFSPAGSADIGVSLTAAAIPLWLHLSLLHECCATVEQALTALRSQGRSDAIREMKMYAALATTSFYTKGPVHEVKGIWTKTLEFAQSVDNTEYRLRALWGLWAFHLGTGEYRLALEIAQKFLSLATTRSDRDDALIGERIVGVSQHFLGDQTAARKNIEHMLANFVAPARKSHYAVRFGFDQRVAARTILARVLWLLGYPDQGSRTAEAAIEDARASNHATSLCYALADAACQIALWTDDRAAAERYAEALVDYSSRFALPAWHPTGRLYQAVLLIRSGDVVDGLERLPAGFQDASDARYAWTHAMVLAVAEGLARGGHVDAALATVQHAIDRCERNQERWLLAELLRLKGEFVLRQDGSAVAATAEDYFQQALDVAQQQEALSWELRAATSLARLLRSQGRLAEALEALRPVYDRFTEGFGTVDLIAAKQLLDEVNDARRD